MARTLSAVLLLCLGLAVRSAPRSSAHNYDPDRPVAPDNALAAEANQTEVKWRSELNRREFEDMSRLAFKSLVGREYRERPLLTPEQKRMRKELRRKQRRWRRRRLPNRPQAFKMATSSLRESPPNCRTELLKQRIRMDGCLPKMIVNRFCFGQCNSFFIPKVRQRRLKAAFQSCSACLPVEAAPILVTLHCPHRTPATVRRKVMKIKRCDCKAVQIVT